MAVRTFPEAASMSAGRRAMAREMELRYRVRSLILRNRIPLPAEAARKLIGPDCAYHLYRQHRADARSDA
jgi:hypothetical protein